MPRGLGGTLGVLADADADVPPTPCPRSAVLCTRPCNNAPCVAASTSRCHPLHAMFTPPRIVISVPYIIHAPRLRTHVYHRPHTYVPFLSLVAYTPFIDLQTILHQILFGDQASHAVRFIVNLAACAVPAWVSHYSTVLTRADSTMLSLCRPG